MITICVNLCLSVASYSLSHTSKKESAEYRKNRKEFDHVSRLGVFERGEEHESQTNCQHSKQKPLA
jgi:hypothetical protein